MATLVAIGHWLCGYLVIPMQRLRTPINASKMRAQISQAATLMYALANTTVRDHIHVEITRSPNALTR